MNTYCYAQKLPDAGAQYALPCKTKNQILQIFYVN